jgi:hypothetical protein
MVYADDVNILGGSVHTVKQNTEAMVVASKEIGLEVNAEKTKHTVMSRQQNAGQNHNTKIGNKSSERVEQFKYLGTTLTHQISVHGEIKSRLKSGNTYYHSTQILLSSSILSKNKTKMYRSIIMPVVLYGCNTWCLNRLVARRSFFRFRREVRDFSVMEIVQTAWPTQRPIQWAPEGLVGVTLLGA